jgi:hypothetical protein
MNQKTLFFESAAAAQSLKNAWTRMASTYKCMEVRLTRSQLCIKPRWFVGGLIKLLGLDLHHTIATDRIRSVESREKWFNYGKVRIRFERDNAECEILLYLTNAGEFCDILKQVTNRHGEMKA